jgi:Ca-activated chloride channel homolog
VKFLDDGPLTFAQPWLLLLLLLVPLVAIFQGGKGAAPAVVFSSLKPLLNLGKARRSRMGGWLTSLLLLALALLIVALARPRQGKTISHVTASGIDIMLALDTSSSMLAEDFTIGGQRSNRLEVVKKVTQKFIDARTNDRIGIVCFAGAPFLVSPLTLDHGWLEQNLERVQMGMVEDGTAIGSGIASSVNRLNDKKSKSRIVVLLTDGVNNAGKVPPLTAAEAAKALGVKVYTIGAGTRGFAPAPVQDMFGRTVYRNVKVDIDEDTLRKIADTTGGKYYRATDTKTLNQIFEQIDQLEKTTVELNQYTQFRELFPWPLGVGLGILLLHALLGQTLGRKLP